MSGTPAALLEFRDVANELADLADSLTLPSFRGPFELRTKADGTWVTQIDEAVERALRGAIHEHFPDHAFLGEEGGRVGPVDAPTWIVDPIDGTTNFVKGNPIFATLIAVRLGGDEMVGVVSAPALGTRWDGVSDGPARQDGRPVSVSEVATLVDAEVTFGGLHYFHERGLGRAVESLTRGSRRQRGYGDFYNHCLVASGSTDVALDAEVNLWDLAAVKVIVEAAGGRFTDFTGVRTADAGDALSTNARLHDQVLELLTTARTAGLHQTS